MNNQKQPLVTLILGGWGLAPASHGNLISGHSNKFTNLALHYPVFSLTALDGLDATNWATGYQALGAGRVSVPPVLQLQQDLASEDFYQHHLWSQIGRQLKKNTSTLQVVVVWDALEPTAAFLKSLCLLVERKKIAIALHLVVVELTGLEEQLAMLQNAGVVVATLAKNSYLDNGQNWQITNDYYQAITRGLATTSHLEPVSQLAELAKQGLIAFTNDIGQPLAELKAEDCLLLANFSNDKFFQLANFFLDKDVLAFERLPRLTSLGCYSLLSLPGQIDEHVFYPVSALPVTVAQLLIERGQSVAYFPQADQPARLLVDFRGAGNYSEQEIVNFLEWPRSDLSSALSEAVVNLPKQIVTTLKAGAALTVVDINWLAKIQNWPLEAVATLISLTDELIAAISKEVLNVGANLLIVSPQTWLEKYLDVQTDALTTGLSSAPSPLLLIGDGFMGKKLNDQSFEGDWSQLLASGQVGQVAALQLDLLDQAPGEQMPAVDFINYD
jgi:hypothetical protein